MKSRFLLLMIMPIVLAMCGIAFTGCHSCENESLTLAESLMDERPDSALAILRNISPEQLTDERQRALCALLTSQAMDKNYIDTADFSKVKIAIDYFSRSDDKCDKLNKIKAFYYGGRVKYNGKEYGQSLNLYLKAYDEAKRLNDNFWIGMCCKEISTVYADTYNCRVDLQYTAEAYKNFKISGKRSFIVYEQMSLARAYLNNKMYGKSIAVCRQLEDSLEVSPDPYMRTFLHRLIAKAYIGNDDDRRAIPYLEDLVSNPETFDPELQALLGLCYMSVGERSKALKILGDLGNDDLGVSEFVKYRIFKAIGEPEKALVALEKSSSKMDSTLQSRINVNLIQSVGEYYDYELRIGEEEVRASNLAKWLVILVALCIIVSILLFGYLYYKSIQKKNDSNLRIAQDLNNILALRETEFTAVQSLLKELIASHYQILDGLCQTYFESQGSTSLKKRISDEVTLLIDGFSSGGKRLGELEDYVNHHHANIMADFRRDFPGLKDADYNLFLYSILGFSFSAMALFLKESKIEAVYNRKARLKSKISRSECPARYRYYSYLG